MQPILTPNASHKAAWSVARSFNFYFYTKTTGIYVFQMQVNQLERGSLVLSHCQVSFACATVVIIIIIITSIKTGNSRKQQIIYCIRLDQETSIRRALF